MSGQFRRESDAEKSLILDFCFTDEYEFYLRVKRFDFVRGSPFSNAMFDFFIYSCEYFFTSRKVSISCTRYDIFKAELNPSYSTSLYIYFIAMVAKFSIEERDGLMSGIYD